MKKIVLLIVLISIFSCKEEEHHTELNSIPYYKNLGDSRYNIDLFIMTAHELSGQIYPIVEKENTAKTKQVFKTGGLSVLKSYFEIAKKKYKDQVVFISNGNSFDQKQKLARQVQLLNMVDFDVLNIVGPEINPLINELSLETLYPLPIYSSNIVNAANGESISLSRQNLETHKIITKNGIKLGIINLSDYDSIPLNKSQTFKGIYFKDLVASTLKEIKALKQNNVNAIIVNININSQCRQKPDSPKLKCPSKDPLKLYIERLPKNIIDLVIASGGIHGSGELNGIPIIKEKTKGQFLGLVKLSFNGLTKKLIKHKISILPPLKTCHHFYAGTNDCYFGPNRGEISAKRKKALENSAYLMVPAMFLGNEIKGNPQLEKQIYKQKTF